jgi:osmotically-inducible protein OsmY
MTLLARHWLLAVAAATLVGAGACERRADDARTADADATGPAQSDSAVETRVQARYFADATVKGRRIDVDADNGVVTLTGTVESEAAKARAADLARQVDGVTRVEDRLRVEPGQRTDATTPDARRPTEPTDSGEMDPNTVNPGWITTKIQSQYFLSPDVKGNNIDVTTSGNGHVTLRGTAESAAERQEAVRIARATDGVRDVSDELRVTGDPDARPAAGTARPAGDRDPGGDLGDGWTSAKIQAKYFMDGEVKGRNIDVTTNNGVVTLRGEVETAAEKRQAVAIARATDGVSDVRDELRMVPDTDADRARGVDVRGATQPVTDAWLTTKIQSKYFLDRSLKARDIDVTTNAGVVTLTGRVENEAQKREAEAIAKETGGVTRVDNKLQIGATKR